jgi:hypothetical protein
VELIDVRDFLTSTISYLEESGEYHNLSTVLAVIEDALRQVQIRDDSRSVLMSGTSILLSQSEDQGFKMEMCGDWWLREEVIIENHDIKEASRDVVEIIIQRMIAAGLSRFLRVGTFFEYSPESGHYRYWSQSEG